MKKLIACAVLAVSVSAMADGKIGVVDMMTLVKSHPDYERNKTLLTTTEKDYQKKLDALKAEVEAVQEEGKKKAEQLRNPMLSDSAKAEVEKELVDIQNRFVEGQQKLRGEAMQSQQQLSELEGRLLKTQTEDLKKKIEAFAAKNGYDLVVDKSAALFSKDGLDVTEAVKGMLNEGK